ncbi:mediator of RNA polymerase II transcription subunit 15a [Jatropha curcas]|uniref:mediator of RNA polymerase II transcription subunit 15a n=1 Tax=Jatropha curcas TaxID=180498 RepID=UPI001893A4AD|nr:mediator of RNA polymerase II transcription subunit 15a [Jatropha curcas]
MDANNWRPTGQGAEPTMDAGDWRAQLQPDSRQRIVNKMWNGDIKEDIIPFSSPEWIGRTQNWQLRFLKEKDFNCCCKPGMPLNDEPDYLRKISLKMLTMESKSENPMPNSLPPNASGNSNRAPDPGDAKKAELEELTRETMELNLEPEELYKDVEVVVCTSSSKL